MAAHCVEKKQGRRGKTAARGNGREARVPGRGDRCLKKEERGLVRRSIRWRRGDRAAVETPQVAVSAFSEEDDRGRTGTGQRWVWAGAGRKEKEEEDGHLGLETKERWPAGWSPSLKKKGSYFLFLNLREGGKLFGNII
jgi:hypothetical protein